MQNLLPYQGAVFYYGKCFERPADILQDLLDHTPWKPDEVIIMGKKILTKRKVAWYGDGPYVYSGVKKDPLSWSPLLLKLKELSEKLTGENYNSCLLNLYADGTESTGWHSDNEKDMQNQGAIASLSFGAERRFLFQHKTTKEKTEILLEEGSLLVMKGETQTFWKHALPPMRRIKTPRVNLTFRTVKTGGGA